MSIPKEPRQLMINLMYLVLTALLALNISSEILNAFKVIKKSISKSNEVIEQKNQGTLDLFANAIKPESKYTEEKRNRLKIGIEWANQAHEKANALIKDLEGYREKIITRSGGYKADEITGAQVLTSPEDLDASTFVMVEGNKLGVEMKAKLEQYKDELAKLVPMSDTAMVLTGARNDTVFNRLPIAFEVDKSENNPNADWVRGNFHMIPTIGASTIIDKYINDVRNAEGMTMDYIWAIATGEVDINRKKIPKVTLPFDKYVPVITPVSTYLLPGEQYKAQLRIGTYKENDNSSQITVNGSSYTLKNGVVEYTMTAPSKEGEVVLNIAGSYVDPNKGNSRQPIDKITTSFFVGSPQATVSLDKMNVFYIGVDNPITIAASGVPLGAVSIAANGITYRENTETPEKGDYFVQPTLDKPGMGSIQLSAKLSDGTVQKFGERKYRIKLIPDPKIRCGGKDPGKMLASKFRIQFGPEAVLENFDFEAKYNITEFNVEVIPKKGGGEILGPYIVKGPIWSNSPAAQKAIDNLKAGDRVYLNDVIAVGPDKKRRNLGSFSWTMF
jgi:gliding motility-associated protein GldM